jgi:serine kinase of HPr protein (carbohydrate metabolism regulator)
LERPSEAFAGVELPTMVLPVRPATSMATLLEVVARDHRSRRRGSDAIERLDRPPEEEEV